MRRAFLRALRSVKARGAQTRCCHPHFPGRRGRIFWGANAGICFLRILTLLGLLALWTLLSLLSLLTLLTLLTTLALLTILTARRRGGEQGAATLKIIFQRGEKEALSEAPRTTEEIDMPLVGEPIHQVRLINIHISVLDDPLEVLNAYGILHTLKKMMKMTDLRANIRHFSGKASRKSDCF